MFNIFKDYTGRNISLNIKYDYVLVTRIRLYMNKVTKTAIAGLLALFAGNAAATDGEIVFDGEILKSACEINDSDKKIEVALGHYNAEQFRSVGDRSPKIPFTIPLVNCPVTGWEHDNGNVEASASPGVISDASTVDT